MIPLPMVAGSYIKGKHMRSIILGSLLALSIVLHIGTIALTGVATVVTGLFESVTGIGTVLGAAGEALSAAEADLKTTKAKNAQLTGELETSKTKNAQLDNELRSERKKVVNLDADLKGTKKKNLALLQEVADLKGSKLVTYRGNKRLLQHAVSDTSSRISTRTATGASRNLAATFGEAWPVAGTAVIVTATTLELYDACVIMRDLHELDVAFNPEADFGVDAQAVCGMKVPSKEEIWAKVKSSPGEAWAKAKAAMPDLPDMPDFYLPEMPEIDWPSW